MTRIADPARRPQIAPRLPPPTTRRWRRGGAQLLLGLAMFCWRSRCPDRRRGQSGRRSGTSSAISRSYFDRLLTLDTGARVWTDPVDWFWGLHRWLRLLGETMLIAYVGTAERRRRSPSRRASSPAATWCAPRCVRMVVRRVLEFCRTVPDIVFALIFVVAFGLGPLPGVLAMTMHTTGTLGKLFAEVVENIDMKPVEGVAATRRRLVRRRCASACCRRCCPTSPATRCCASRSTCAARRCIGFVGAGGIGQELIDRDPQILLLRCQRDRCC